MTQRHFRDRLLPVRMQEESQGRFPSLVPKRLLLLRADLLPGKAADGFKRYLIQRGRRQGAGGDSHFWLRLGGS